MAFQVYYLSINYESGYQKSQVLSHIHLNHNLRGELSFAEKNRSLPKEDQIEIWLKDKNEIYKKAHIGHLKRTTCNLIFNDFEFEKVNIQGVLVLNKKRFPLSFIINKFKTVELDNPSIDLYLKGLSEETIISEA